MPRIQLAYWHGDHAPGDEVNVSDDELAALTRDGRVAEVLQEPAPAETPAPAASAASAPPVEPSQEQPETAVDAGRKRR
ncbi:hypothetical protein [Streptomyces candidus]|uniref:3-oxoacyl-ACP reductase-like protein n=1 Tax=Streptomyces candidus TaxID=67283 RepID=A0A7X0LT63_9ACTN|nr:hypothetical protein [Streptomyces candidus]MBB6439917.1 3-oxoacyl-ACP reductase-like protein [Streptomyces candidus]GHH58116.1 hypothetical protein GCM10018773_66150 [Streptomyces candidus]